MNGLQRAQAAHEYGKRVVELLHPLIDIDPSGLRRSYRRKRIEGVKYSASGTENKIKIIVGLVPPHIENDRERHEELADLWCDLIAQALDEIIEEKEGTSQSSNMDPWGELGVRAELSASKKKFAEKTLCKIVVYHPKMRAWDLDNRLLEPIVDGLISAGTIERSGVEDIAFVVLGEPTCGNFRTEITLMDYRSIEKELIGVFGIEKQEHIRINLETSTREIIRGDESITFNGIKHSVEKMIESKKHKKEMSSTMRAYHGALEAILELEPYQNMATNKEMLDYGEPIFKGAQVVSYPDYTIVKMPSFLPNIARNAALRRKVDCLWENQFLCAWRKHGPKLQYEKAFVLVNCKYPKGSLFHINNRAYKPIFDAVNRAEIIPDDESKYMGFMVNGIPGEGDFRTDIFVADYEFASKKFSFLK